MKKNIKPMYGDEAGYTAAELSAIFSNLAKGCEKQYKSEMSDLYMQLSTYYGKKSDPERMNDFNSLAGFVEKDLSTDFAAANEVASRHSDRGALRALKWAEKVSRMLKSHLKKASTGTPEFIENTNVYVCDICGFVFVGDKKPDICPICKVPNIKMTQIRRGA